MFGTLKKTEITPEEQYRLGQESVAKSRALENGKKPSSELTKRELLAAKIFAAFVGEYGNDDDFLEEAVRSADALLFQLEKIK